MSHETDFAVAEGVRTAENAIRIGTVAELDAEKARVRIKIGDLLTDWIPWLTQRAGDDVTWWCPSVGEQMLVLSPSGDLAQAVCLSAIYSDAKPAPIKDKDADKKVMMVFKDKTVFVYDKEKHSLTITLPTEDDKPGTVNIVADVHVTGNITASQDITDKVRSMQGDRDIYNDHKHDDGSKTGQRQ